MSVLWSVMLSLMPQLAEPCIDSPSVRFVDVISFPVSCKVAYLDKPQAVSLAFLDLEDIRGPSRFLSLWIHHPAVAIGQKCVKLCKKNI